MATVTILPDSAGDETDVPVVFGAATQWQACLSDDADTSYIANDGANFTRSLFNLGACGLGSVTISNVTIYAKGRSTTNGTAVFCVSCKDNGTAYNAPVQDTTTSYQEFSASYDNRPGGGAWTVAAVDALQAGCYIVRPANKYDTRCTYIRVVVTYTAVTSALGAQSISMSPIGILTIGGLPK